MANKQPLAALWNLTEVAARCGLGKAPPPLWASLLGNLEAYRAGLTSGSLPRYSQLEQPWRFPLASFHISVFPSPLLVKGHQQSP